MRSQDNPVTDSIPRVDALRDSPISPVIEPLLQHLAGGSRYAERSLLPKEDLSRFSQVCGLFAKKSHSQMKAFKVTHLSGFCLETEFLKVPMVSEEIASQINYALIDADSLIETLTKTWYRHEIVAAWELYCLSGNSAAIQYAIETQQLDPDTVDANPMAMLYAAQSGSVSAMQLVHDTLGIPWNVCDEKGNTTLHYATASGSPEAVTFLRQEGLDALAPNRSGTTSIDLSKEILSVNYDNHLISRFYGAREAMENNGTGETISLKAWVNSLPSSETIGHVNQYNNAAGNPRAVRQALTTMLKPNVKNWVSTCHIL